MKILRALFARLAGLIPDPVRDLDRAAEIEANLQLHMDDNIRQGMNPHQARREALLKLGGVQQTSEAYRDQATFPVLENLIRDIRFAVRQLRRNVIHSINSDIVTMRGQTMTDQIGKATYLHRSLALLVGGLAALALLLGVIGLCGVVAYSVGCWEWAAPSPLHVCWRASYLE
jgi:hypothetical protein